MVCPKPSQLEMETTEFSKYDEELSEPRGVGFLDPEQVQQWKVTPGTALSKK